MKILSKRFENWTTLLIKYHLSNLRMCQINANFYLFVTSLDIRHLTLHDRKSAAHLLLRHPVVQWCQTFPNNIVEFQWAFLTEASASGFSTSKRQNTVAWGGVLFDTDFSSRSESETRAFFSWFHVGTTIASQPYLFIARLTKAKSGNRMNTQRLKPLDAFAFFPSFLSIKNSLFRA